MKIIDFHNHFYPPEYIAAIRRGPSQVIVTEDDDGNPVLHSPGDSNVAVPGHRDLDARVRDLDRVDVTKQVLTFTSPGTHIEAPRTAVSLARQVNDIFTRIKDDYSERFTALATLPLNDPTASVHELDRVTRDLNFRGIMVFSNVNGKALAHEDYWPLYERANDLGLVLYIHPTHPVGVEAMKEYWLMPLVGFLMDTTLAAAHLVFSGVVERFPNIRWVLGHLGGAVPYLAERFDRGYEAFPECRQHVTKPPSEYFKEFFFDTVNFDQRALRLAVNFAGASQLLAGSDYPHQIGSLEKMVASIDSLDIPLSEKDAIRWGNTHRLLEL